MKENQPSQYDSFYVPWGKGSIVHSLIDAVMLYLPSFESKKDQKIIADQLRSFFVSTQHKKTLDSMDFNQSLSKKILALEDMFNEDTEYKLMRMLELEEKEWKAGDFEIVKTSDNLLWQGNTTKNKADGYGW